jgi:hypothetical protein
MDFYPGKDFSYAGRGLGDASIPLRIESLEKNSLGPVSAIHQPIWEVITSQPLV